VTVKKLKLLKCELAAMYSWQHFGKGTFSYRQPRHLVIMDQWNGQQSAVAIKIFYMFGFLQLLLGFSNVSAFVNLYICRTAPLTSRRCIVNIYSTNIRTEYFKHDA
jgi:hypothetical protein